MRLTDDEATPEDLADEANTELNEDGNQKSLLDLKIYYLEYYFQNRKVTF